VNEAGRIANFDGGVTVLDTSGSGKQATGTGRLYVAGRAPVVTKVESSPVRAHFVKRLESACRLSAQVATPAWPRVRECPNLRV
jgi:hypothetical protein